MGEPVSVIENLSSNPGLVRFETNRSFTGMGHERYWDGDEIIGDRPPDDIARILLGTGRAKAIHIYAQTITVELKPGADAAGMKQLIEDLYIHYKPGVAVPVAEDFA